MQTLIAFLLTFVPITISPGPANLLLASSAAAFGVKRTLSVLAGITLVFAGQIIIIGVGIGELLFRYPILFEIFKYVGAAFLLYLAYLFFQSSGLKNGQSDTKFGFREGALLQVFNFKALTVPLILFTQFLTPQSGRGQIMGLGAALAVVIVASLGAWTVGGSMLRRLFQSEFGIKWQGKIFGSMLVLVTIWILVK